MTVAVVVTLCSLLLIAYLFDLTASKTKIPSVILLFFLGWLVKQLTEFFNINLPDLSSILPILGTVGLILIVLEGSLELELNRSKFGSIKKSFAGALLTMLASAFIIAFFFHHFGGYPLKYSLLNAIPLCIISSAIAIPSVRNLSSGVKEFVIYESSLSDILGVLFFNFISFNKDIDLSSFWHFGLELLVMSLISFIAGVGLSFLLSRIEHHIKFVPIILLVILIYEVSKIYHLPALIFILLFGLFIGNLDEIKHLKWTQNFKPATMDKEVKKFKELTIEASFLVRALFFLLFGYLLETAEILNTGTLIWAGGIVVLIFVLRALQLKFSGLLMRPLLFVAPRGLITILLFLSIDPAQAILLVNRSLIIQVIVITALIMMVGLMTNKKPKAVLQKSIEK